MRITGYASVSTCATVSEWNKNLNIGSAFYPLELLPGLLPEVGL